MANQRTPVGAHGKVTTSRRSDGIWVSRTNVRDLDGVLRPVRSHAATRAKAEVKLRQKLVNRARRGAGPITPDTRLRVVVDMYRQSAQFLDLSPQSRERYEWALKNHILPGLGALTVNEVQPGVVTRWLRGLTVTTRVPRTVLKQVLDVAVLDGAIGVNPVAVAPRAKRPAPRQGPRALRDEELFAVRDAIAAWERSAVTGNRTLWMPLRAIVILQLVTGTRIGEVLAIRWRDIDLDRGVVEVNGTLVPLTGQGLLRQSKPKTPSGRRELHALPSLVVDMLRAMLAELPAGTEHSLAPVLASRANTFISPHNARRAWRSARRHSDVDLSWVTPHALRRTAGTTVAEAAGVLAASKFLGHATTAPTEASYLDRKAHSNDLRGIVGGLAEVWA